MGIGKDKNAGGRAADQEIGFLEKGITRLDPFRRKGQGQLSALRQGASAGGLDKRLQQILSGDTFGALTGERERAVGDQLASGGLTRSGFGLEQIANVPAELALQLEQLLTGRSQQLAGQGLTAAGAQADIFGEQGASRSAGTLSNAGAKNKAAGQLGSFASAIFFSDKKLKENIQEISMVGDLKLCEWDWIEQTKGTIIEGGPTIGFIAQDVQEKYPEFVGEYAGWLFIDYGPLMQKLRTKYIH